MMDNAASDPAEARSRLPVQHRVPAYLEDYQVGLQTSVRPSPPAAASRSGSHQSSPSRSAVGPDSSGAMSGKRSLQQTQDEVDEELSDLDDWPEALQPEASQVETSADKLKRKYWWKSIEIWAKLIYILAVIAIIILILLVIMWISPEKS